MSWANSLYGGDSKPGTSLGYATQEHVRRFLDRESVISLPEEDQFAPGAYWESRDKCFMSAVIVTTEMADTSMVMMWLVPNDTTRFKPTVEVFSRESVERVGRRVYRGNIATAVERFLVALTRHSANSMALQKLILQSSAAAFTAFGKELAAADLELQRLIIGPNAFGTPAPRASALHAAYLDFDATVRGIVANEAPHATVVTDFTTKAMGRPFVAYISGPFTLEYTGRIDDRDATTASVLRSMIHEAQRKIGRAQCGGSK